MILNSDNDPLYVKPGSTFIVQNALPKEGRCGKSMSRLRSEYDHVHSARAQVSEVCFVEQKAGMVEAACVCYCKRYRFNNLRYMYHRMDGHIAM